MESTEYRLQMEHIGKQFGGIKALDDVSIAIRPGEIHALVGENGAGKSTLIKILAGAYTKDSGRILLDGKETVVSSPLDAIRLGIAVIYQEFMLAPHLSVAENIYIDQLSEKGRFINWVKLNRDSAAMLKKLGFSDIDPAATVGSLSVAHQQIVEICKCLKRNASILVLDEPTAVLTVAEIEKLFHMIRELKAQDVSIIFISHHMNEIFDLCDSFTVLKDGKLAGSGEVSASSHDSLIQMMIGRELTQMFPKRNSVIGEPVLQVDNLNAGDKTQGVSFEVRAGEVVGFAGLVGAGRTETMLAIYGSIKRDSGTVRFLGEDVHFQEPQEAVKKGLGYLSEDRKTLGLLIDQSIRMNSTLSALEKITKNGFLKKKQEKTAVEELLSGLSTKYRDMEDNVSSLSGGNQQKISFAKWVFAGCKCIIFDEPTRGVDVGAKVEIYNIINHLAEQGIAIIIISSEMTEVMGICDRALVMAHGKISGELTKDEMSEDAIIKMAVKEDLSL